MKDGENKDLRAGAERLGQQIGRRAAKLWRDARPAAEQLAQQAIPRVEKLGRRAIGFAQEHEDELKGAAVKLARARITGPLGIVVDAMGNQPPKQASKEIAVECKRCGAANPMVAR